MPNCNRIKRPCKICLETVSAKNGLQCNGSCQSWIHYRCLNYTPGKIKDIKAGIIKVNCPCPDCRTTLPKERRTDEPFSCNNLQCPAHHPPKCGNIACPINKGMNIDQIAATGGCALSKCGKSCKTYSHSHLSGCPQPQFAPSCAPPEYFEPSTSSSVDDCLNFKKCPSGCVSNKDIPGDYGQNKGPSVPSLGTLEDMCNTVGQLTNQINNLMMKMQQAVQQTSGGNSCSQRGPNSNCPQPCFCPGNPRQRKC